MYLLLPDAWPGSDLCKNMVAISLTIVSHILEYGNQGKFVFLHKRRTSTVDHVPEVWILADIMFLLLQREFLFDVAYNHFLAMYFFSH